MLKKINIDNEMVGEQKKNINEVTNIKIGKHKYQIVKWMYIYFQT